MKLNMRECSRSVSSIIHMNLATRTGKGYLKPLFSLTAKYWSFSELQLKPLYYYLNIIPLLEVLRVTSHSRETWRTFNHNESFFFTCWVPNCRPWVCLLLQLLKAVWPSTYQLKSDKRSAPDTPGEQGKKTNITMKPPQLITKIWTNVVL